MSKKTHAVVAGFKVPVRVKDWLRKEAARRGVSEYRVCAALLRAESERKP